MDNQEERRPEPEAFDAYCLILGFTSALGSGCTFLAEGVARKLGDSGRYYRLSGALREEAARRRIDPSVSNLQTLGDALRLERGNSILAKQCLDNIKAEDQQSRFTKKDDTVLLIDGIKNGGEVKYLRQFPNFYLISVHAEQGIRQERLVGEETPPARFRTEEEFLSADRRDEQEDIPHGQEIKRCNYLADIIVNNGRPLPPQKQRDRDEFFNAFINDYIYPMRKIRKGEEAHDRPPRIEESLMTTAYCVSKRSSCLKRKVGAVIAYIRKIKDVYPDANHENGERDLPLQIVSSGYNDVPAGIACVFAEWQGCYRDSLLENHAKIVNVCPNCGEKLPDKIVCAHCGTAHDTRVLQCKNCRGDLLADYTCAKCEFKVFRVCLPGKEAAPGKLLDMCRALHAEENAILGLSGISKAGVGDWPAPKEVCQCELEGIR